MREKSSFFPPASFLHLFAKYNITHYFAGDGVDALAREVPSVTVLVQQHPIMPPVPAAMQIAERSVIVGGTEVGAPTKHCDLGDEQSGHVMPARGPDKAKRKERKCSRCVQNKGGMPLQCKGRGKRDRCEYFDENGVAK